jgi:hypothetical protein
MSQVASRCTCFSIVQSVSCKEVSIVYYCSLRVKKYLRKKQVLIVV